MTTALAATGQAGIAQSQRAAQDVQEQSRQIDSLKRDLNPVKDKSKKLREACEGFESVFIQKMWEQMRATVPKGGLLQGRDEQYWQGMFDQELSKKMSSAGGIGLADMMYEQLSRNLVSASRTTASGLGAASKSAVDSSAAGTGFVVSAAPLLPPIDSAAAQAGAMYSAEVPQPEAGSAEGQSQSTDAGLLAQTSQLAAQNEVQQMTQQAGTQAGKQAGQQAAQQNIGTASPSASTGAQILSAPPEVQQVLEQLRAQAQSPGQPSVGNVGGIGNTMTGAQAIATVQAMTPAQALALSQGMSWAQVQNMTGPAADAATGAAAAMGATLAASGMLPGQTQTAGMGQPPMPGTGLDAARNAAQVANTRMPSGGVLPPMTPLQRQSQIQYSAAKVAGSGGSSHSKSTAPAALAPPVMDSTMPVNPVLHSNVQGNPGVSPSHFVQNSPLIPPANSQPGTPDAGTGPANGAELAANNAPMSMTAEQIAAMAADPQLGAAQGANPAIPPTAQEAQVINNTFTTNIPPNRRNSRQGQRIAKGAAIRTLNAG